LVIDPINSWIRRGFVRRFLSSDIGRMSGIRHASDRLIEADDCFAAYIEWIRRVQH
jgi:hypothetical protein